MAHARQWCEAYFDWYNFEHHHSGLASFTPEQMFTGRYYEVVKLKQQALDKRFEKKNPERFVKGRPHVKFPPKLVAINPSTIKESGDAVASNQVNFPTLAAAGYVSEK